MEDETGSALFFVDEELNHRIIDKDDFIKRLQRTICVLVAAGHVKPEKVIGAYEIAGWH